MFACLLLVTLRVSIGWQFLYEGLWKLGTQKTAKPWTSEGYLANARGPFRSYFRSLVDDPDGLKRLDFDATVARVEDWKSRFESFYVLTEDQRSKLDQMWLGASSFRARLDSLPAGIEQGLAQFEPSRRYKTGVDKPYVRYDAKSKSLVCNFRMIGEEKVILDGLAGPTPPASEAGSGGDASTVAPNLTAEEQRTWWKAVERLYEESGKLGLRERLQVWLQEDPARLGQIVNSRQERLGEIDIYRKMLERYDLEWRNARIDYQFQHQERRYSELMAKRAELIGPIDGSIRDFETKALGLLDVSQLQKGPLPVPFAGLRRVDLTTMWLLTGLGVLLILGLFTRVSCLAAAGLMVLFYLPQPPWPGVPEPPGPEHSLIVNKNLIEAIALLALAFIPSGQWIGLDSLLGRVFHGGRVQTNGSSSPTFAIDSSR
ncbi:MAG: hypothetical protein ACKO3P_14710 [Planctomycetaceae bacterium]